MKYPQEQFEVLVKALKKFNEYLDLSKINEHALHFEIFQQFSEGHKHNRLRVSTDERKDYTLYREGRLNQSGLFTTVPLIDFKADFELYPNNTIDDNIATAMRKAIKEVTNV